MPTDLTIRCRCGSLRGAAQRVDYRSGMRVVCYCDDCQAFANFLDPSGAILDARGGTDIFQMSPARLKFSLGIDKLACLSLTPKGPLRWYASCCKTPVGNTPPTRQLPFVGLIHSCMAPEGRSLEEILGPVRIRVMGRHAKGGQGVPDAYDGFSFAHIAHSFARVLIWRLRGEHKRSPFFDSQSGAPVARPQMLTNGERR